MGLDVSLHVSLETRVIKSLGYPEGEDLSEMVFTKGITHNLNKMAKEVGIYTYLWRPEELGIKVASELIRPLEEGLLNLKMNPEEFRVHDSPNGWGTYEDLVAFVEEYLEACKLFPNATIGICR